MPKCEFVCHFLDRESALEFHVHRLETSAY